MPTITFSLKDLQQLAGRKISPEQMHELAHYFKGEFQGYNKATDEATVELDDTNLPYLWSVEGMARLLRGVFGAEKGIALLKTTKGPYEIIVDESVKEIRPYIEGFVAKGRKIDEYLLKQLIQLQEKYCDSYGRRREKASIGMYSYRRIKFPLIYKAASPGSVKFPPLGYEREMTLAQIIEQHPKGKEYGKALRNSKAYPILTDSNNQVLSLIPIINSNSLGKLEPGDTEFFFEVTGTDAEATRLATNIFAYALHERGFQIYSSTIRSGGKIKAVPDLTSEKLKISSQAVRNLLGLDLKDAEIRSLLEKARYGFNNYTVEVPPYRADIMHPFDIIEDIAIMYGFDKITPLELESYTTGKKARMVDFVDITREIAIGLGYQEVLSQILASKATLYDRMATPDPGTVEIENPMSENFSAVRTWLLPVLLEMLSKNKHADYPQKVFEQGLVTERKGEKITDHEKIALASCHNNADYTEARQTAEHLMRQLGFEYKITEADHPAFIKGRVAALAINKKTAGFFGEIAPEVLANWGLETPVCAVEIDLSELRH